MRHCLSQHSRTSLVYYPVLGRLLATQFTKLRKWPNIRKSTLFQGWKVRFVTWQGWGQFWRILVFTRRRRRTLVVTRLRVRGGRVFWGRKSCFLNSLKFSFCSVSTLKLAVLKLLFEVVCDCYEVLLWLFWWLLSHLCVVSKDRWGPQEYLI